MILFILATFGSLSDPSEVLAHPDVEVVQIDNNTFYIRSISPIQAVYIGEEYSWNVWIKASAHDKRQVVVGMRGTSNPIRLLVVTGAYGMLQKRYIIVVYRRGQSSGE